MNLRTALCALALIGVTALVTNQVLSQEKPTGEQAEQPERSPEEQAAMEAWMKHAMPGEHHAHLKPLVGQWMQTVKWRMAPEAPWQEGTGHCEYKLILGGRYLMQTLQGDPEPNMPQPFEGLGLMGYDNYQKKYTSVWIDNMSTMTMTSSGTCDGAGKVFTLEGQYTDAVSGKTKKFRSITRIEGPDKHTDEMYEDGPDGKPFKMLEVVYTRKA